MNNNNFNEEGMELGDKGLSYSPISQISPSSPNPTQLLDLIGNKLDVSRDRVNESLIKTQPTLYPAIVWMIQESIRLSKNGIQPFEFCQKNYLHTHPSQLKKPLSKNTITNGVENCEKYVWDEVNSAEYVRTGEKEYKGKHSKQYILKPELIKLIEFNVEDNGETINPITPDKAAKYLQFKHNINDKKICIGCNTSKFITDFSIWNPRGKHNPYGLLNCLCKNCAKNRFNVLKDLPHIKQGYSNLYRELEGYRANSHSPEQILALREEGQIERWIAEIDEVPKSNYHKCCRCKFPLHESQFSTKNGKRRSHCKECQRKEDKARYLTNKNQNKIPQ